jgi:HK97 family phage major capsid protein/HK97 family phage prohead protease
MPWHLSDTAPGCKGWAVVKDADGEVVGCHPTKEKALAQLAALNINVKGKQMDSLTVTELSENMDERAVDNSSWDGGKALAACSTAADYRSICAGEHSVGEPDQRQHWALPHHYLGQGPNADGVRNAMSRLPQTEDLTNRDAARRHLEAHMGQIQGAQMNSKDPSGSSPESRTRIPRDNLVRAQSGDYELREIGDGQAPILFGHLLRHGEWTEINSAYEGNFMEQIAPGAAKRTIQENGDKMRVLFNHGRDVTGDQVLGRIAELRDEAAGVYYEVETFPSVPPLILEGLRAKQYGASFRFHVMRQQIEENPEPSDYNPKGLPERTIKELQIAEFGPVTFPAYAGATAGLRSMTDEFLFDRLADDPDKVRQLVEYHEHTANRADAPSEDGADVVTPSEERREEPETPGADAPTAEATAEVRQTETEVTRSDDKMDPNKTLTELEAREKEIGDELQRIDAEAGTGVLNATEDKRWKELEAERKEIRAQIVAKRKRLAALEASSLAEREDGFEPFNVNRGVAGGAQGDDIYDLSSIRGVFDNPEYARQQLHDRAMKAIEKARFPEVGTLANGEGRRSKEDMQERVAQLLSAADDSEGTLARRILQTGHPLYETAFWKALSNRGLTGAERAVIERALSTSTAGYAVPFALDPTVTLTSNGVANPLRAVARIVTIAGETWKGVNSAGVTASRDAEAAEVSDDTPTLTQPSYTVSAVRAFVPFSIESEDWTDLRAELTREFQDAKDTEEGSSFTVGTGAPVPQGVIVGATNLATTSASSAVALVDLDTLADALPERYQPGAAIMASRGFFSKIRQLARAATSETDEWPNVQTGNVNAPQLIGYPKYINSNIVSTITTGNSKVAIIGDFQKGFLIVDRIGMNVELIPHLFATANNLPSGQRGLFAYWRNTSGVRDANAFRVLLVKP